MPAQPAKNTGPTRTPYGILYGSYMGIPYGTGMVFATGFHIGPTCANPSGSKMGTIPVPSQIWPKWP